MAKPGVYVKSPQWWKHLRWAKRTFWKSERKAAKHATYKDVEHA